MLIVIQTGLLRTANILPTHTFGRQKVNPEKALLITLWFLGNTETYRQISERFNITRSCAHGIINKVVSFLVTKSPNFIVWPRGEAAVAVRRGFYEKQGIDRIEGAIDGTHIKINKPKMHQEVCGKQNKQKTKSSGFVAG